MLESSSSPIVMCNCTTLIHQQGSTICRYERPLNAKVQIALEMLLQGKTPRNISRTLNLKPAWIDWALRKARKTTGTNSSLECARLALRLGWIQQ